MKDTVECIYGPPPVSFSKESNYKIVIFDLGGVLVNLNIRRCIASFTALMGESNMCRVLGLESGINHLEKLSIGSRNLMRDYEQGRITSDDFVNAVSEYCVPGTTDLQIRQAWLDMLGDIPQYRLDFISQLRDHGVTIGLLSNTNEMHWEYLKEKYCFDNYFDRMFASHELHLSKPDPEIFRLVAYEMETDTDTLYVDDMELNRQAAQSSCGWLTFASLEELMSFA